MDDDCYGDISTREAGKAGKGAVMGKKASSPTENLDPSRREMCSLCERLGCLSGLPPISVSSFEGATYTGSLRILSFTPPSASCFDKDVDLGRVGNLFIARTMTM